MNAKHSVVILALGLLLPALLLASFPMNAVATDDGRTTSWLKTTLNNTLEVSQSISVQVDGQGYVYVSYYSGVTNSLMFETNYDQPWTNYHVDEQSGAGFYNSIDVVGGQVAIAYYDSQNQDLKFAYGPTSGLSWNKGALDQTGDVGKYCSVASDNSGNLGISYYDSTNEKLKYLSYDYSSGEASIETVGDMNPGSTSVSFFSNNTPVITYMDKSPYHLKYAMRVDGTWKFGDITSVAIGDVSSSSTDIYDTLHVAFINSSDGRLGYAKWSGGAWTFAYPDPTTIVAQSLSIRPDVLGKAHISYYSSVQNDLMYATNRDGPWSFQTLDSIGNQGSRNAIGVDNYTKVHVVYIDSEGDLNTITNSLATWDISTIVPEMIGAGENNSLVVDAAGNNHIAFSDPTDGGLYYYQDANGTANVTLVDSGGVGQNPSICLDQDGNAFISYYDHVEKQLKMASNHKGFWTNTTVDTSNAVGLYSSIAVGSTGKIFIVYSDDGAETLKFAVAVPINENYSWTINLVDESIVADPGLDMVMASDGILHLSFFQDSHMWYGMYIPSEAIPDWTLSVVDDAVPCGISTSIAVSPGNVVYMTYFVMDLTEQGLRLAYGTQGNWQRDWVMAKDASGPGYCNSISLDQKGIPHVAYIDKVSPSPLLTSDYYDGLWSSGMIDDAQISGKVSSTSDQSGRTHIVYYDADQDALKLATLVVTPGLATGLTALAGDGMAQLSWTAPTQDGGAPVTSYVIFRGLSSNELAPYKLVTGTNYDDNDLANGLTYYYSVKAVNSEGAGPASNQVSASPQGEESSEPIDYTLIIIVAIAAVVAVVAIVLVLRYRR
jgi:hypothetical protein